MRTPTVSVCIPAYQGGATIGAAIDSVLAQSFGDFELHVLDDGSTDDTEHQVRLRRDDRLHYRRHDRNLGPQGNWNHCLAQAQAPFIKLLPHDDLLHPHCLARQVAVLQADAGEQLALVAAARDVIGPDGRVRLRARGFPGQGEGALSRDAVLRGCLHHGTNVLGEPGAVLFRRSAARAAGGFDASLPYVIDLDYWLRLLQHGQAWYCAEALASFRVWKGSWSVAIGSGQAADFHALLEPAAEQAGLQATPLERLRWRLMPGVNALARQLFYRLVL